MRLRPLLLRRVRLGAWLRREGGRLRRVRRRRRVLPAEERHLLPADLPRRVPAGAVAAGGGQERATGGGGAVERYGSFGQQQFHSSCRSKRRQPLRHPSSQLELQSAVARKAKKNMLSIREKSIVSFSSTGSYSVAGQQVEYLRDSLNASHHSAQGASFSGGLSLPVEVYLLRQRDR